MKEFLTINIDAYQKHGIDLIENIILASSTGFTSFQGNAAGLNTRGMDIVIRSTNIQRTFQWTTGLLFSYVTDKVTAYDAQLPAYQAVDYSQLTGGVLPVVGKPLNGIYAYRFAGLDPANGDPLGYQGKTISKNYNTIITNATVDSLQFIGSSRPRIFGSLINNFSFKGFTLSVNVIYKLDYWFKKQSVNINYQDLLTGGVSDYSARWQKPGDELITNVPSLAYPDGTNDPVNRNLFYQGSAALVEKGDHIRLQDISISYNISRQQWEKMPFTSIQVYGYLNNLGIIWKANKAGLDPDYATRYAVPNPKSFSIGIKTSF